MLETNSDVTYKISQQQVMLSCVVLENVVHAMKREGTVQLSSSVWQLQLRLQGRQTQFEKLRVASVSES